MYIVVCSTLIIKLLLQGLDRRNRTMQIAAVRQINIFRKAIEAN